MDVYDAKAANGTKRVSVGLVYRWSASLYLILGLLVLPGCCQKDFQRCCAGGSEAEGSPWTTRCPSASCLRLEVGLVGQSHCSRSALSSSRAGGCLCSDGVIKILWVPYCVLAT